MFLGISTKVPFEGNPCSFPLNGNVDTPLMDTLKLFGFTIGLLVWLLSTLNALNSPYASQASTIC